MANGVELEYETLGDPHSLPLLLISGLGSQLISWEDGFCEGLVARGFYVIRHDNRDSGLSTKFEAAGPADVAAAVAGKARVAYTLDDMAADAAGLLDALGIPAAHIVGASMGGFIAQLVALNHRDHVLTLTSIMSGPGGADAVPPTPEGTAVLVVPPQPTRDRVIEQDMWVRRQLTGRLEPFDEGFERDRAARMFDRTYYPAGVGRQLVASIAAPGRLERLRALDVPTLVIHGLDDIIFPPENGRRVAAAVPGARLIEIDGMNHELPKSVWPRVIDAIAALARQATATC